MLLAASGLVPSLALCKHANCIEIRALRAELGKVVG